MQVLDRDFELRLGEDFGKLQQEEDDEDEIESLRRFFLASWSSLAEIVAFFRFRKVLKVFFGGFSGLFSEAELVELLLSTAACLTGAFLTLSLAGKVLEEFTNDFGEVLAEEGEGLDFGGEDDLTEVLGRGVTGPEMELSLLRDFDFESLALWKA